MQAALKAGEVRLLPSKRIAELSLSEYAAIKQGQHNPGIQTGLRCRALAEDVPYRCRVCGISEWQGQSIVLRLDHVNGDRRDHSVLAFICPNCDSQQPSYHYRNRGKYS